MHSKGRGKKGETVKIVLELSEDLATAKTVDRMISSTNLQAKGA